MYLVENTNIKYVFQEVYGDIFYWVFFGCVLLHIMTWFPGALRLLLASVLEYN
jgi:hypothetical protein